MSKALIAILLCAFSFSASAQKYGSFNKKHYTEAPRPWQRVYGSYDKPFGGAVIDYRYRGRNYYGKNESVRYTEKLQGMENYGFGIGTFFPICKMGPKSKLCLSTDVMINMYNWKNIDSDDENTTANKLWNFDSRNAEMVIGMDEIAAPVTLDYKTGCDAMQSRDIKGCFTIGIGTTFSTVNTFFYDYSPPNVKSIHPVLKMETGFRWGMCFKLRMMCRLGRANYMLYKDKGDNYEETFTIYGRGNVILSILVVPAALSWSTDM